MVAHKARTFPDRAAREPAGCNLVRLYESQRGSGCLDDGAARARLAHVCFAAGRSALRSGRFRAARSLFAKARTYGAGWGRLAPVLTAATVLSGFERTNGVRK